MIDATHGSARRDQVGARGGQSPIVAAIGPAGGESAIRMACAVAAHEASPILVVSVVAFPPVYDVMGGQPLLNSWPTEEQRVERLQDVQRRLHHLDALHAEASAPEVVIRYGPPATAIADLARERRAKLIVMGWGPRGAKARLFGSETPLETSRRAPCPVLVVSDGSRDLPCNVVVATDFSPASLHAAIKALAFVADGCTVHLVHAWTRIGAPAPVPSLRDFDERYAQSLPARMDRVQSLLGAGRSLLFTSVVREGHVAEVILNVTRETSADLLVAGTRGLGTIDRFLVGSVSTSLLRGAACSVLLAPAPEAIERARIQRHMTGTSTVSEPEEWSAELEAFARRNHHRRTTLEVDDQAIGAQIQESGYTLSGATYDPHDRRVELMFEQPARAGDHLTRSIAGVRSVAVASNADDRDSALCIESEHGSVLLTFLESRSSGDVR